MSTFYTVSLSTGAREGTYKPYKTHRGAKNFAERLNTKAGREIWGVASAEFYADVLSQRTTTVTNIMSGTEVEIQLVDLGGPCDPSTERYHCM